MIRKLYIKIYQMLFIAQRKIFIVYFYLAELHKHFFNFIH